ncbi:TatD family hydrolase [Argonema antarcticum]|uniref:TatD family hydrolase n=1 Tax=Argonema antarcticum TaxID=2942763 RepID=UPI0020128ED4|nr:TatD family hydrolase [Argonema antarcticum]MCL1475690.1 TatD family hydrolase [Argonema antarcticum A004/B2]
MQLIDTHVHINFDVFEFELEAVRQRWLEAGVIRLVHSCVEPDEFASIQAIAHKFPEVFFAVGLHPLDAHKWVTQSEDQILSLGRSDPKVVAIGEMGLDFYKAENQAIQETAFLAQLDVAQKLDKPVIIHCRDAAVRMRELLQDFWDSKGAVRGVMHCWGGGPEETEWFVDLGFYISFSGIVTFKNAVQVQESARMVPISRLLIETDCPFLAPVPKRGKRNEPAFVRYVADRVAGLRGVSTETIAKITTENAYRLFGFS